MLTAGPHAVTQALVTTGVAGRRHHETFHRFFSRGTWSPDAMGRLLYEHAVAMTAALEDACESASWAAREGASLGVSADSIVLCGESAGGNLAAAACLAARDRGEPRISAQVLIQPVLDFTRSSPSISMGPEECLVPEADLAWYYREYMGAAVDPRDPRVSPTFARDLQGLPPALIVAAEDGISPR